MKKEDYLNYLNGSTDHRLITLEEFARNNHVPIIQKEGIHFLTHMIKLNKAKKILEIGTAIGYSAINFALIDKEIAVTTIERDKRMYDEAIKNINQFNLMNQITVVFEDALQVDISHLGREFDILFVDAAKGQYQKFFEKYAPLVKKGGIIFTDNLLFHNFIFDEHIENRNTRQLVKKIKLFNEWLANNENYDTRFLNIGDGIAISIKK